MKRLTSSSLGTGADEMSFQVGSELKPLVSETELKKCKGNEQKEEELLIKKAGGWLTTTIKAKGGATKNSDVAKEKNAVLDYALNKQRVDTERAEKMASTKAESKAKKRKLTENFKGSSLPSL